MLIPNTPPGPWTLADGIWFANHPDRDHRLRESLPGEIEAMPFLIPANVPAAGHVVTVAVKRGSPAIPVGGKPGMPDIEAAARALYEGAVEAYSRGNSFIPGHNLTHRILELANARGGAA